MSQSVKTPTLTDQLIEKDAKSARRYLEIFATLRTLREIKVSNISLTITKISQKKEDYHDCCS